MLIEERKVEVEQLRMGMYVCRLDRDWSETPFPLQGFLIENESQIAYLRRVCDHVYVDIERGVDPDAAEPLLSAPEPVSPRRTRKPRAPVNGHDASRRVEEELPEARQALDNISDRASGIIDAFRSGRAVSDAEVRAAVEPVVASLLRNPDAFFWLQALRKHGEYAYSHAVNCCALAAAFGRHLGLPEQELKDLATGGMLVDIGMTLLPDGVVSRPGPLSAQDRSTMQEHVELGAQAYRDAEMDNQTALSMLRHHHERHDGSGYPQGLSEGEIPLPARIAAIVDSYDAMITPRPYRDAMSRHAALQSMYRDRGRLYQDELIEQFMQCLGVYPVGSLVELSNGEVGIVMALNPARRLRPALMLLTDRDKQLRDYFEPLDLMLADRAGLPQAECKIVRGLQPGAYGLEPTELYL